MSQPPKQYHFPIEERAGSNGLIFDHHNYTQRVTIFAAFTPSPTLSVINIVQYDWGDEDTVPNMDVSPWFVWSAANDCNVTPSTGLAADLIQQLWRQIQDRILEKQMGNSGN